MAIKLDPSWNSFVVLCTDCPYWYALRFEKRDAFLAGEAHAIRVHDVPAEIADNARRLWERRHAADS